MGGVKIVLDGGSPGRSAHLLEPYHRQAPGESGYRGYSHFSSPAELHALVTAHFRAGNPVYLHALGDAAVEEAIGALRAIRSAVARLSASNCPGSHSLFTRPHSKASAAEKGIPV